MYPDPHVGTKTNGSGSVTASHAAGVVHVMRLGGSVTLLPEVSGLAESAHPVFAIHSTQPFANDSVAHPFRPQAKCLVNVVVPVPPPARLPAPLPSRADPHPLPPSRQGLLLRHRQPLHMRLRRASRQGFLARWACLYFEWVVGNSTDREWIGTDGVHCCWCRRWKHRRAHVWFWYLWTGGLTDSLNGISLLCADIGGHSLVADRPPRSRKPPNHRHSSRHSLLRGTRLPVRLMQRTSPSVWTRTRGP